MAESSTWTVYVPDRSEPIRNVPRSLTIDEVRQTLTASGFTSVQTAEVSTSGDTITFRRPSGGSKGI